MSLTFKPHTKYGVELEFASGGASESRLYDAISSVVASEVSRSETPNRWTLKRDCSCGWEVTSPAYEPINRGIYEIREVIRSIRERCSDYGSATTNHRCGLHIHLATDKRNRTKLQNFIDVVWYFEPTVHDLLPRSRHNGRFCLSLRRSYPTEAPPVESLRNQVRYMGLNLNYGRPTVEIRYGSGTTNSTKAANWLRLWLRLHQQAYTKRKPLPNSWSSRDPSIAKLVRYLGWSRSQSRIEQLGPLELSPIVQNTVDWLHHRYEELNEAPQQ